MPGKHLRSLSRIGLAMILACGLVPAAAFAADGKKEQTPPHRGFSSR